MDIQQNLIDAREQYIKSIRAELLGPGSEISIPDADHEVISGVPEVRYSIGILFPQKNKMDADNDENAKVEATAADMDSDEIEQVLSEQAPEAATSGSTSGTTDAEEDNLDEEIGLASQNMPSSMGITFFVAGQCNRINCKVSFGTYKKIRANQCLFPAPDHVESNYCLPSEMESILSFDNERRCFTLKRSLQKKEVRHIFESDRVPENEHWLFDIAYKLCDQLSKGFIRSPHEVDVELDFFESDYVDNNRELDGTTAKLTALRRKIAEDIYSVTVMLVNETEGKPNGINCLFQPNLLVKTENNTFRFFDYSEIANRAFQDEEERMLAMQYRKKKVYGTGLGTSLNWEVDENGNGYIMSDFFPEVEIPAMNFDLPEEYHVEKSTLSMKALSDLSDVSKEGTIRRLNSFIDAYRTWIDGLDTKAETLDECFRDSANKNIAGCRDALIRMENGIRRLTSDDIAWVSFRLANRAMYMQREQLRMQSDLSNIDRFPEDSEVAKRLENTDFANAPDKHSWRPFQLAFLLMSICAIADDNEPTRDLVDLIWFPTGGGKTEAYLGLTAFTIFYRRLAHQDVSAGTTVIMRYTLRLLAAQQFTRAATLICACEIIRRMSVSRRMKGKIPNLGENEITIGLWIGGKHTPNRNIGTSDIPGSKEHVNALYSATYINLRNAKDKHNKFQLLKCPWCGTKLVKEIDGKHVVGQWGYKLKNNKSFYMSCPQAECPFSYELPIQVVDEELYKAPPTLLFGTVDKFAMLPWKKEIGAFFAEGNPNRAPELIIQDELHLISGPLGTMVGLYETVIDALCSAKGVRPKIVASTATIRRAREQCSALYNREVVQFPAPGLDSNDSFFAKEAKISHQSGMFGRTYIGLMPSGKTKAMMEVRTIAALMQEINTMELPDEEKDKLWTLTIYFNSLKDLGKCSTLIDDDVKDFIKRMAYRLGTARNARLIGRADELTSRVSTTELNETLDKLEKLNYSKENITNKRYASNALLATNMISVGIDVARLNVMLLVGQPKLTSEYIQASSRVGRSFPGVAFTLYDGSKSRDRSHYEQFKAYHESFYRYVEPTGATPFSKPARDRALHAVVVSFLRHYISVISEEETAGLFDRTQFETEIDQIKRHIIHRNSDIVQRLDPDLDDDGNEIDSEIDAFLDEWQELASGWGPDNLFYGENFMFHHPEETQRRLLKVYNSDKNDLSAKDTMTSMRNVDSTVASNVLIWEE